MTNYGQPTNLQNLHIWLTLEITITSNHILWQISYDSTSKSCNSNNSVAEYDGWGENGGMTPLMVLFSRHVLWGKLFFNYCLIKINDKKNPRLPFILSKYMW